MASKVSLAIRSEEAWMEIHRLVSVLQDQADLRGTYFLIHHKDPEVQRVLEVEEFARFLSDLSTTLEEEETPPSPSVRPPAAPSVVKPKR